MLIDKMLVILNYMKTKRLEAAHQRNFEVSLKLKKSVKYMELALKALED